MSSSYNFQFNMPNTKVQLITFNTFFNCNCWNSLHGANLQLRDGMLACN
jgi:hypothetical protein